MTRQVGDFPTQPCVGCGRQVLLAYQVDGAAMLVDAEPTEGGELVPCPGRDVVTALYGVDPGGEELFGIIVPAGAPRYTRHGTRGCR